MAGDFDRIIERAGTGSLKFDGRHDYFGRDDVLPMWVADMDFAAPEAVTAALEARARHPVYGYTRYPDTLFDALLDWCHRRYDWSVSRDMIMLCPGVVPSLNAAVLALTEPGDRVVVQPPVYFPFFSAVTTHGRELVENPLRLEHGRYRMDLEHLEKCAKQGASMLILCSPHNPVGRVWDHEELQDLLTLARRYRMTIVSDEIHADLVYPGQVHLPLATLADDVDIVTALAPSKTFNIPGMGLSALVVSNPTRCRAIQQVFDGWHVSAGNPFSICAFEAAYRHGEAWLDALRAYLAESLQWAGAFIEAKLAPIEMIRPEGTYLLWLDCRGLQMDDADLHRFFIDQATVGMSPGSLFGVNGRGFMRLNIGTPKSRLNQALTQIAQALSTR